MAADNRIVRARSTCSSRCVVLKMNFGKISGLKVPLNCCMYFIVILFYTISFFLKKKKKAVVIKNDSDMCCVYIM